MTTYAVGDTITLKALFTTPAGVPIDPTAPTLKIYDASKNAIVTKAAADLTHVGTGSYEYDYTTTAEGDFAFEYAGSLDGYPELARKWFSVTWDGN